MNATGSSRPLWETGVEHELAYWREYLATKGFGPMSDFQLRFDPQAPLQPHLAERLPLGLPAHELPILDCAAGPATTVGKVLRGEPLPITAVDALAERYAEILRALELTPPVPSRPCEVERLDTQFGADTFALVYMRFALDHCYDPILALRQMVRAVRPGCVVMVEHYRDEHEAEYQGLKHWTMVPEADDLIIRNAGHEFSVREEVSDVHLEIDWSPTWLTLVLHKRGP